MHDQTKFWSSQSKPTHVTIRLKSYLCNIVCSNWMKFIQHFMKSIKLSNNHYQKCSQTTLTINYGITHVSIKQYVGQCWTRFTSLFSCFGIVQITILLLHHLILQSSWVCQSLVKLKIQFGIKHSSYFPSYWNKKYDRVQQHQHQSGKQLLTWSKHFTYSLLLTVESSYDYL